MTIFALPGKGAEGLCPHYEGPEDDPIGPCVQDAIDFGSKGAAECWKSWDGPRLGFVCPFMD